MWPEEGVKPRQAERGLLREIQDPQLKVNFRPKMSNFQHKYAPCNIGDILMLKKKKKLLMVKFKLKFPQAPCLFVC